MQSLDNPQAPPVEIDDHEFERYAGQGYPTSERDGRRIVHVPDPIYQARKVQAATQAHKKVVAKRRAKERNGSRERSKQRRLAKAGR